MLKYSLFILHSIVEVGGVYDEAQHEGGGGGGEKRNESGCLLDTTTHADER